MPKEPVAKSQSASTMAPTAAVQPEPVAPPPAPNLAADAAPRSRQAVIGIVAAVVAAGLFGGGMYWWSKSRKPAESESVPAAAPAVSSAPPSVPAASADTVASTPAPVPIAPSADTAKVKVPAATPAPVEAPRPPIEPPAPSVPVVVAAPPVAKPELPKHVALQPRKDTAPVSPPASQNALADKVAALLTKAEGYIANQQYDKAIATGENALVLDPDNAAAKSLIKRAKAKQLDALKTGTSLD